jgi:hypothetical protein
VRRYLALCGYSDALLCADFQFGDNKTVGLAAFAHEPMDARSACIAAIEVPAGDVRSRVITCRELGAPVVLSLVPGAIELWKHQGDGAELVERLIPEKAEAFFRKHARELGPGAVFRAKTWGRLDRQFQLSFVDAGLLPLVEQEAGQRLTELVERVVHGLRHDLWPKTPQVSVEKGHWVIKSAFWLLAAKILQDKRVKGFIGLDLTDVENVFARVARHYDSRDARATAIEIENRRQREALAAAAAEVSRFSHLGHVTTESLAHVYESALITKETRAALGTHSTPQYLVDYVVWKLAPWIRDIPEDERDVFEPASGHAAFLIAAMRLLKEELSPARQAERKQYLRAHLHGVEIDAFAIEIARLSLTLADIPNPNGWDLVCDDMFTRPLLASGAQRASILLGNPPFEDFPKRDREEYAKKGSPVEHVNKTAEVLAQALPQLRVGGVFGFVVPQGFLHSSNAADVRSLICHDFEIQEICLFPDRVFSFSDAECAVMLGRRVSFPPSRHSVSCRRVREADIKRFQMDFQVTTRQAVPQALMCNTLGGVLRLPDLFELWERLRGHGTLAGLAELGQGLAYLGAEDLPKDAVTVSTKSFRRAVRGFARFGSTTPLHGLPAEVWMNVAPEVILHTRTGTTSGIPQVLLNYAPVGRGPWRLKALIDSRGHAVTSRFITIRPLSPQTPLEYLWGLLNNPLANAYVYAHSMKRDVLVGMMRQMPIPVASEDETTAIAALAREYMDAVGAGEHGHPSAADTTVARHRLLMLDAAVLRLYDLPPRLERQLLDLFRGQKRVGVPFRFDGYFPPDFEPCLHLHEYLSEGFANSSAKAVLASHRSFDAAEVSDALRRATDDFED